VIDPIEIRPAAKAANFKTIRIMDRCRKQVVIRVVDEDGKGVQLTKEPTNAPAQRPRFGYETSVGTGTVAVRLIVVGGCWGSGGGTTDHGISGLTSEDLGTDSGPVFVKEGKILAGSQPGECQDCDGIVEFDFQSTDLIGTPGIYLCQIERYVTGGYMVDAYPAYLYIEPNLRFHHDHSGVLSIPEIRLALGDTEVNEVSLLDNFEFTDTEIAFSVRRVVDYWNQTPPPVSTYTYENFPFRYWWTQGVMIELLRIAAKRYARNRLQYSAGGVQIDDQNKANDYTALANDMKKEFDEWFVKTKVGQNMARAWGSMPLSGMRSRGF
jgi:hypothetical protein